MFSPFLHLFPNWVLGRNVFFFPNSPQAQCLCNLKCRISSIILLLSVLFKLVLFLSAENLSLCFKTVAAEFGLHFSLICFSLYFCRGWLMWTFQTTSILRQPWRKTSKSCWQRKWVSLGQIQARVRRTGRQVLPPKATVRSLTSEWHLVLTAVLFQNLDQPKANNYFYTSKEQELQNRILYLDSQDCNPLVNK